MTVYGYARVSTCDQNLDLQLNALKKAGCQTVFQDDGVGGTSSKRDGLAMALAALDKGDVLIVWRLDRLARSMLELVDLVHGLHSRGIGFRSLCEHIDVSSAFGELVLHILSAIAHFERALIVERTVAGMQAAKERGVEIGRRPALNGEELREALYLMKQGMTVPEIALQMGVGRSTLYRYVAQVNDG